MESDISFILAMGWAGCSTNEGMQQGRDVLRFPCRRRDDYLQQQAPGAHRTREALLLGYKALVAGMGARGGWHTVETDIRWKAAAPRLGCFEHDKLPCQDHNEGFQFRNGAQGLVKREVHPEHNESHMGFTPQALNLMKRMPQPLPVTHARPRTAAHLALPMPTQVWRV